MPKHDIYKVLLNTLGNPTKLSVMMLLSRHDRMTVTQMSKLVKVTKANLYHFVNQMVRDGMLSEPEAVVNKNFVEKFYHLDEKFFKALDPEKQRKRLRASSPSELKTILQSALVSIGLDLRLIAEELSDADTNTLAKITKLVAEEKIILAYTTLSDKAYDSIVKELKEVNRSVKIDDEVKISQQKNRVLVVALPRLTPEKT